MKMWSQEELKSKCMNAARKYIEERGDEIIETDWEFPNGTVDIVTRDANDCVHFIEVLGAVGDWAAQDDSAERRALAERDACSFLFGADSNGICEFQFDALNIQISPEVDKSDGGHKSVIRYEHRRFNG